MNTDDSTVLPVRETSEVQPTTAAVRSARLSLIRAVRSWPVPLSDESLWDVELCAAELMTNAVENTRTCCRVTVRWTGVRLRVEVMDAGPGLPQRSAPDDMATAGRGLLLVEALAHSWGWYPVETGKVVWFEVAPDRIVTGDARLAVLVSAVQVRAQQQARAGESRLRTETVR
ncbi:ATP-binding protein [Kitasatospora sp. NPDC048538]|uniref:ATP-binding protein n=1 Tax=unclassified Kitasatospora TaxID=2633591 RepID=UPI0033E6DD37